MRARYQALDSWRGVAAILVVVYHGAFAGPLSVQGVARGGYLWVDFFFVLSGFVIAHAYGDRIGSGRDAAVFLLRRFGRLWPLHATMLMVFLAAEGFAYAVRVHSGDASVFASSANDNNTASFSANLVLLNAMGLANGLSWNGPSWSIGAEFWAYVAFSGAALLWRGPARLAALAMIAASAGLFLLFCSPHAPKMNTTYDFGFVRALYGFFIGALVQAALDASQERNSTLPGATAMELGATFGVILFLMFCSDSALSVAAPLAFAPLVFVFAQQAGALSTLLGRPIFVRLGMWSYSIYMIHPIINNVWTRAVKSGVAKFHLAPLRPLDGFGQLLFTSDSTLENLLLQSSEVALMIAVVTIASFTYDWIESPARLVFNAIAVRCADRPPMRVLGAGR